MVIREFLYLDIDKVRGIAAQLYEGVIETVTETSDKRKDSEGGLGQFKHARHWGSSSVMQKSLADALFPTLESDLESEKLLRDISSDLQSPKGWEVVQQLAPTGSLIRVSGPAALFDARYFANVLASVVATGQGVEMVTGHAFGSKAAPSLPPKAKTTEQKRSERAVRKQDATSAQSNLEDLIPTGSNPLGDSVTRENLVGMVKVARGVFSPGVHFNIFSAGSDGPAISARLEEGKQFLDAPPEILFQRYGVTPQEWSIVGIVGHHGVSQVPSAFPDLTNPDGSVSRSRTASGLNQLVALWANLGFVDLPRSPGFSIVPLAVYRVIGGSAGMSAGPEN